MPIKTVLTSMNYGYRINTNTSRSNSELIPYKNKVGLEKHSMTKPPINGKSVNRRAMHSDVMEINSGFKENKLDLYKNDHGIESFLCKGNSKTNNSAIEINLENTPKKTYNNKSMAGDQDLLQSSNEKYQH